MADAWAAAVLSARTVLLVGQGPWTRHKRRTRHARVAALRLHRDAQADLTRLTGWTQARPDPIQAGREELVLEQAGAVIGPDLIGDFYRVVVAELQTWAEQTAQDLERLHGRRLAARRRALCQLRAEIRALCAEIEEREALWKAALAATPSEAPESGKPAAVCRGPTSGVGVLGPAR